MLDLEALKRDRDVFLAELEIAQFDPRRTKYHCPFHNERTPSMDVECKAGVWLFKCFGCGKAGTFIDAAKFKRGLATNSETLKELERELGVRFSKPEKKDDGPPVIDATRVKKFVDTAHELLMDRLDIQEKWMHKKRGLTLKVCEQYRVGFLERFTFQAWPGWQLSNAWILPITDAAGEIKAVKVHFETPPKRGMKCMWAPFGLEPADKPRHAWPALWPPPEAWRIEAPAPQAPLPIDKGGSWADSVQLWSEDRRTQFMAAVEERARFKLADMDSEPWSKEIVARCSYMDFFESSAREIFNEMRSTPEPLRQNKESGWVFLCPGELKALAMICVGYAATSVTSGESQKMTPAEMGRLKGQRICVVFDDDESGHKWRNQMVEKLKAIAREFTTISYGSMN